jgi:hypothetical protein
VFTVFVILDQAVGYCFHYCSGDFRYVLIYQLTDIINTKYFWSKLNWCGIWNVC